ncbi:uncharacterized protein LOC134816706 isoform X2 [Bolinopsis microptera]|uniref:uncharacterized protein LOC134816706 isoform X2 n=1 Tax=Bolinopsis microptera TaxID=2820187 RepID=UPI00307AD8A7
MNTTWNSNGMPAMQEHGNATRAKTYTNSGRYNRSVDQPRGADMSGGGGRGGGGGAGGGGGGGTHNQVDLQSMYYDQNSFYQPYPTTGHFNQFSSPNMSNNFQSESMNNGQYMPNNYQNAAQQQYSNQYQNQEGMMNLNPYATEFNPVPAQQNNTYNNRYNNNQPSEPTHYKDEFSTEYSHDYKTVNRHPHNSHPVPIRQESEDSVIEVHVPEGAVTLLMPHVYLGKFMMNRSEFEKKYGVSLTTNSKDGGYLIIIIGEKAEEASKEVEMMWKEEPITSSDNITEGKHVIKVAPDRYEGVVCVPTEHYQALLAKRNTVESKHKVRILIKQLQAHNCYRAVIRAGKKTTAGEAADDLETLVMSPEPAEAAAPPPAAAPST